MTVRLERKEIIALNEFFVVVAGYCAVVESGKSSILSLLRAGDYCIPGGMKSSRLYVECLSNECTLVKGDLEQMQLSNVMSIFYRDRRLQEIRATSNAIRKIQTLEDFVASEYKTLKLTHSQIGAIVGLTRVTCTRAIGAITKASRAEAS